MLLDQNAVMTTVLALYAQSQRDIAQAIAPIPDADLAQPMGRIVTHPAWTLSHLCGSAGLICHLLSPYRDRIAPADFAAFGPGSQPVNDRSAYPTKNALLTALGDLHAQADAAVRSADQAILARPPPAPFDAFASRIGDMVVYLLAAHESYHLSLLLAWHRTWEHHAADS